MTGRSERIEYRSRFLDIDPPGRIVFAYRSEIDGRTHAVSLVTVQLAAAGDGADLTYTDQYSLYVYPGDDPATTVAHHEGSIRLMVNGLAATVRKGHAS